MGVATDASGNVVIVGYTSGNFDGNTQIGLTDFFVTNYDASGTKQWTHQLGASGAITYGRGVAIDSSGNVFVTGETYGSLDGNTRMSNFFVTKYNSNGGLILTRQRGVSGKLTEGYGIATDASGNVFVAGRTAGSLDETSPLGAFVIKINNALGKQ